MALKPNDIKNKEFNTKFNGFSPEEVNKFLKQVFNDYSDLLKQNKNLKNQDKKDSKLAKEYLDKKHTLNSSILVAQQAADNLKAKSNKEIADAKAKSKKQIKANEDKSAKKIKDNEAKSADNIKTNDMKSHQKADQIVASAKDEANNILENAGRKANRLSAKTATLWRGTKDIHTRAVKLSKAFLSSVDSSDWSNILNDGDSQSKKTLDHANEVSKVYHNNKADNLATKSSNK